MKTTGICHCEDWHFTHSESRRSSYRHQRGTAATQSQALGQLRWPAAGQRGGLETTSKEALSRQAQDRDSSVCSGRASSLGRNDHQASRRHESLSACGHRQLFATNHVVDSRRSPREWRNLPDPTRGSDSAPRSIRGDDGGCRFGERKRERGGRCDSCRPIIESRSGSSRGHFLQFHDRGILALSKTLMAVPQRA